MFIGQYSHNIDSKGRLILPSKFRDKLGDKFIITCGLEQSLVIYPEDAWKEYIDKLSKLPYHKKDMRAYIRLVLSTANEVETDKLGRFTIPANLRKYANLKKEVIITGIHDKIELWDKKTWKDYINKAMDDYENKAELIGDLEGKIE